MEEQMHSDITKQVIRRDSKINDSKRVNKTGKLSNNINILIIHGVNAPEIPFSFLFKPKNCINSTL